MKNFGAFVLFLAIAFGPITFVGAMEQQEHQHESSAQGPAAEGNVLPDLEFIHLFLRLVQAVDGPVRVVLVKNCEKPSMPLAIAKEQRRCYICERAYDDLEHIAVLPCGDTLCCRCADRAISCRECCPVCDAHVEGYRTKLYFFKIKNFRDEKMEMPLMQKGCVSCAVCLEDFKDCQEVAVLPCGHAFCLGCADHTLTTKEECPLCRTAASGYRQRKFFK